MALAEKPAGQRGADLQPGERWIASACSLCYSQCSIRVKVKDGVALKIEGNPDSPIGAGRLCPKGVAGLMTLYDPNRVKVPLMRTNPEKGLDVDPKWKEISWEEALTIVAEKLKKVRADNPRKLVLSRTTTTPNTARSGLVWSAAFGSPNVWAAGGGLHCGNGAHLINGMFHSSWSMVADYEHCNYALYFGASKGHSAGHSANPMAHKAATARDRGMRLVVVDPVCNFAGGKAGEWVPIRVGTDSALALAMVNVLLNELGLYDAEYLKTYTNAPYLIKGDGHYLRHAVSNKPLVWDTAAGAAREFYDPSIGEYALLGQYTVNGVDCRPAFQLFKEHVKKYTPERVADITTVPATTIRRLAKEFGTEARIGSTIEIEGKKLPYRPVSATYFRGAQGHRNSTHNCLAIEMLNQVVGASDVPGGALGFCPVMHGHPDTGQPWFEPYADPDGLLVAGIWLSLHKPYPPHQVPDKPNTLSMSDVWPLTMITPFYVSSDQEEIWSTFGVDYRPEIFVNYGSNPVMSAGNREIVVEALKKIPFMVSFDLFITETSELCDIILPDTSYLERWDTAPQYPPILNHPSGPGEWAWPVRQPAVDPIGQARNWQEVLYELADRVGFLPEFHSMMNLIFPLKGEYALGAEERYTWEEICDRRLKTMLGPERGMEWFKENGVLTWPKTVEEAYFRPFNKARVPFYYEALLTVGEQQKALCDRVGFSHRIDWSWFNPLPEWRPCCSHQDQAEERDLYAFYYRDVLHTNSFTFENPWLDEVAQQTPFSYRIAMNAATARKKGLNTGDRVVVESATGRKARGRVAVTETIHPECIAVAGCAGHFTHAQPIAYGKGVRFNELLELDFDHCDPVNLNLDLCVKVKVYRDPEPEPAQDR